jgi:hypothetical protein
MDLERSSRYISKNTKQENKVTKEMSENGGNKKKAETG